MNAIRILQIVLVSILTLSGVHCYSQKISNPLPAGDVRTPDHVIGNDSVPSSYSFSTNFKEVVIVRLKYRTDILQGLEDAVAQNNIKNAVILSGIGSLISYHIHSVDNSTFPSKNVFYKKEIPADVVSVSGYIIDGRVHAHIGISDGKTSVGGHLEPGTRVFTFCIITIGVLEDDVSLHRVDDKTWR
jgi:predicted DNA-binding protein with PD1-like motif